MLSPACAMRHGTSIGVPMYNWKSEWDWTDPEDGPASWAEYDKEAQTLGLKTVSVKVLNGLESSVKRCSVKAQTLCDLTSMPILLVLDGDLTLRCEWYDGEWVSDPDRTSY